MRKTTLLFILAILVSGCGPQKKPVQNEFLHNTKQSSDIRLAKIAEEIDVSDGVMFSLDEARIVSSIPNIDPDSPFDKILSKTDSFLICKATVWKTKPQVVFPKFDVISVVPTFGTFVTDEFLLKHAAMAYSIPIFNSNSITQNKQQFLFVYEVRYDEPGWAFHFYKNVGKEIEIFRIIDSGT